MKALNLEDDDLVAELLETVVAGLYPSGEQASAECQKLLRRIGLETENNPWE